MAAPTVPSVPADPVDLLDLPADRGAALLALDRLGVVEEAMGQIERTDVKGGWTGRMNRTDVKGGWTGRMNRTDVEGGPAVPFPRPVQASGPSVSSNRPVQPPGSPVLSSRPVPPPSPADLLHRLRTSARRLRSALRAYRPWLSGRGARRLGRDLRALMQATSPGRDLDVQLAWLATLDPSVPGPAREGVEWVAGRARRRRERLHRDEADAIARLPEVVARARARLGAVEVATGPVPTPSLARAAAAGIRTQADLLDGDLGGVVTLADRERSHRARIHAKRLRYLVEPFAPAAEGQPLLKRVGALQDDLGALRDAQVLAEALARDLRKAPPGALDGVKWLAERVSEREVLAWTRLGSAWLSPGGGGVVPEAREFALRLERRGLPSLPVEIERKYLLSTLPPAAEGAPWLEIRQGYLPGSAIVERLRQVRDGEGERWYRTVKSGRGVARIELEEEVPRELFDALWPLTEGRRLEKRRHLVPEGDLTWEVDAFADRPLVLAEVELPNEAFEPAIPHWLRPFLIREVTGEVEYLNSTLAR